MKIVVTLFTLLTLMLIPALSLAQDSQDTAVQIKIMTFNIWLGGEVIDFARIVEAVQAAGADVVGLQEGTGNTRKLAEALGWQHYDEQQQIISRYPLINPNGSNDRYLYVMLGPGRVIAMSNVHLPSDPYGPYAARDGAPVEDVIALENETRLPYLEPYLTEMPEVIEAGIPLFMTGDFNAPSHLDWTEAAAEAGTVFYPVQWPVSLAAETAGFIDTYRTAHPDPVALPGVTWTLGYPYPRLREGERVDRIDLVLAAGDVEVIDSQIVGPAGGNGVDIGIENYGSDHLGVVSTVRVVPGTPPVFAAVQQRGVAQGERIVVRYHAPNGEETDRIVIVPEGGDASAEGLMWLPPMEASFFGSVTFGTGGLAVGHYEAVLIDGDGVELSRSGRFTVTEPGAPVTVSTDKPTYTSGESITVRWANAPAMRWDWIGVYAAGDGDLYNNYLAFTYTEASVDGELLLDASVLGEEMLPSGDYVVHLLLDDGYSVIASAAFTVTE